METANTTTTEQHKDSNARFATEGVVDAAYYRAIKREMMSPGARWFMIIATVVVTCGLILLGCFTGKVPDILLGIGFAVVMTVRYYVGMDRMVRTAVKRQEGLGCKNGMKYASAFCDDGVHVKNKESGGEGTIGYSRLSRVVETADTVTLFSQTQQMIPVFKAGLPGGSADELKAFLKGKNEKLKFVVIQSK